MRACLSLVVTVAYAAGLPTFAQQAYPDVYIQDVEWTEGTHHFTVPQAIFSPGVPAIETTVEGTADVEFVSATQVRLTDGFHAGALSGNGRFRAHIDEGLGDPMDIVIITPDAVTHVTDEVLHVEKWEKLELGVILPEEYHEAIDQFFRNYYPFSPQSNYTSNPSNTDPVHDLNPYADDSLQLVMTLTDPSGDPRMKWGFYMREAEWDPVAPDPDAARLVESPSAFYAPYNIRFRFAPDEEGTWHFALSIKAPNTLNVNDEPLEDVYYNGYSFVCDPPVEDNKGYLEVNDNNRRVLQFAGDPAEGDETPFFALGTNMADIRRFPTPGYTDDFLFRDFETMQQTMVDLHAVGGNFLRMYMMRGQFAPEWQNLGVYDRYRAPTPCATWTDPPIDGNCQSQCWAFDKMLDQARANDIYVQLCIDPYPPIVGYEVPIWGNHAYVVNYVEPSSPTRPYDVEEFFYTPGLDPLNNGVFYYWKRKYKYIMSRWGYSVNFAIIEPFNEIDQTLSYTTQNLEPSPLPGGEQHYDLCPETKIVWTEDPTLPETIDSWFTDISKYVRDEVTFGDPVGSSLGEKRPFLVSFTQGQPANTSDDDYFLPFRNENVDIIDVHKGYGSSLADAGTPDTKMNDAFDQTQAFLAEFPEPNPSLADRKLISHGEFSHFTELEFGLPGSTKHTIEGYFHNYDVSFHNELWASAFSGKFAAGTSWNWERVFWWRDALKEPPWDQASFVVQSNNPAGHFLNQEGDINVIDVGGNPVHIKNRKVHHHFKPLADLLALPGVQNMQFFTFDYSAESIYDSANDIECFYLTNGVMAIGWVHNRNAWTMNNFYLHSNRENFLGCNPPNVQPQEIEIDGLYQGHDYYIHWFPTRMNTTDCPADDQDFDGNGTVTLRIDNPLTMALGGTANNYLDTLHADYAFIISPMIEVKSLSLPAEVQVVEAGWDFTLYPNPTRSELYVRLPDETPKTIVLRDLSGRLIKTWSSVTGSVQHLPIEHLSKGAYWVVVSDAANSKAKKLIVH